MKKFITGLFAILFFTGCNDSAVPLGPVEEATIDHRLTGFWEPIESSFDTNNEEAAYLVIVPFNEHEFYVGAYESPVASPEETLNLRGFITPFEGRYFVNIQPLTGEEEPENYLIYEIEITDNNILTTRLFDQDMSHISTTEELRAFVKTFLNTSDYNESDIAQFRRKEMD